MVYRRGRVNKGDDILPLVHHINLMNPHLLIEKRLFYLNNDVATVVNLLRTINKLGSCLFILFVVIESAFAGTFFKKHGKTICYILGNGFGAGSYASLIVHNLSGNTNDHDYLFLE